MADHRARLSVAALAAATLFAAPANASAATSGCDGRGGRTLQANATLRFYEKTTRSGTRLYACRYHGNRNVSFGLVGKRREVKIYGVNGPWLFWVNQTQRKRSQIDTTTRYSDVVVWNADSRKAVAGRLAGFAWTAATVADSGRVAGSGDAEGQQLIDPATGTGAVPVSGIFVFDPKGAPVGTAGPQVRTVATASLGSITAFGATPDTIVWRQPDGLHTAPFVEPSG